MPFTFLLFLAFLALWPLGAAIALVLAVGLFVPRFRTYARRGFVWGVPAGLALSLPFAWIGFDMTGLERPGSEFLLTLGKVFFAGFAIGTLVWYVWRVRPARRGSVGQQPGVDSSVK